MLTPVYPEVAPGVVSAFLRQQPQGLADPGMQPRDCDCDKGCDCFDTGPCYDVECDRAPDPVMT